ncbi:primosomal protein N' (replication factor Y) - superfamily II helicase [Maritimibacter sp. 55A14]|uniref:primosomal protein N' (replication factor Y) - superfamily II helicase n=1 Tax=Maritimibacter sp. 55A14 TaxID=2174844 RepID=UPI000D615814|nr:primosomal protein N' (replication factor Y) - superfamily II helicase [Maritimibacter sp. 55A14]PWE33757.1 primosomal protein N' (replication factor Y) - superfamily II helicase [Maritimibacter sp. 55A14]
MPPTQPPVPEHIHRFPCDACGADMRYDPAGRRMLCDHCGNETPIDGAGRSTQAIRELDFRAALEARLPEAEMAEARIVHCTNCGADVEFDADLHAAKCPFCASPVVTDTGRSRQIKPRALVPFALDEPAARKAMTGWLGRLWFAPDGLKEYARKGRRMQGIYVPFWTYDADTASHYRGERGTVYYETRTVMRDGKRAEVRVARVSWTPVAGRVARAFDDVLVLAAASLPRRHTDALAPWDLSGLEPYTPAYLAGFRAESYTVTLEDGFAQARAVMDRTIERDVKFDIGGDRQRVHAIDTEIADVTFKHILLPVWLAAYKFRGKTYRFVVNGQTGKVSGERPWSAWKIALAVTLGLIAAAVAGYFAAQGQ